MVSLRYLFTITHTPYTHLSTEYVENIWPAVYEIELPLRQGVDHAAVVVVISRIRLHSLI